YPRFMGYSGYRRYMKESGYSEVVRMLVKLPKPDQAKSRLYELMSQKWLWSLSAEKNCVGFIGLDHGIGHFMLVEVDSGAQAAAPPMPILPQTSSAASDRKIAPPLSSHQVG